MALSYDLTGFNANMGVKITGYYYNGGLVSIKDFNGDGKDDLALVRPGKVPSNSLDDEQSNIALIYGGKFADQSTIDATKLTYLTGLYLNGGYYLGGNETSVVSIASGGDFSGDGLYNDVILGLPNVGYDSYVNPDFSTTIDYTQPLGRVAIVYGDKFRAPILDPRIEMKPGPLNGKKGLVIDGAYDGYVDSATSTYHYYPAVYNVGKAVSGLGDVHGDGRDDLGVAAHNASYIVNSRTVQTSRPDGIAIDEINKYQDFTGTAIRSLTGAVGDAIVGNLDFNNDGKADSAFSAVSETVGSAENAGKIYVVYGRSPMPATLTVPMTGSQGFTIHGASANDGIGSHLVSADVNCDGKKDLIFTARSIESGNVGQIAILYSQTNMPDVVSLSTLGSKGVIITGIQGFADIFPQAVGDLNGDGCEELGIAGRYTHYNDATRAGFVLYGSASLASTMSLSSLIPIYAKSGERAGGSMAGWDPKAYGYNALVIGTEIGNTTYAVYDSDASYNPLPLFTTAMFPNNNGGAGGGTTKSAGNTTTNGDDASSESSLFSSPGGIGMIAGGAVALLAIAGIVACVAMRKSHHAPTNPHMDLEAAPGAPLYPVAHAAYPTDYAQVPYGGHQPYAAYSAHAAASDWTQGNPTFVAGEA